MCREAAGSPAPEREREKMVHITGAQGSGRGPGGPEGGPEPLYVTHVLSFSIFSMKLGKYFSC
jgi:hypothetical protein